MARKPKPEDPPASKAYLVSFGDTMTALLAFFIVLLSLADDQTGMNMHTGTGSFVKAMDGIGIPGAFKPDDSAQMEQQDALSPLYLAPDPDENDPDNRASGPDDEDNAMKVNDREEETFKRFLNEMDRLARVDTLPEATGEVVFDIFNQFNRDQPHLKVPHQKAIARVLPVLRKPNYQVEIIVWATMPSRAQWLKSGERATRVIEEITNWARLPEDQLRRLRGAGKPWKYADVRRPVMTIVVRKLDR